MDKYKELCGRIRDAAFEAARQSLDEIKAQKGPHWIKELCEHPPKTWVFRNTFESVFGNPVFQLVNASILVCLLLLSHSLTMWLEIVEAFMKSAA